ncbi:MAG: hypothetical protein QOD51_700 [Candidatus Eremiobacteraeota bacterium]|nr:hypothetical protein [Candidatus Eremiobacteraeota bacterium]
MPTREDVLAIRSIEEAFDLSTERVRKREVALIRVAEFEDLIRLTGHAEDAMDDEAIAEKTVRFVIRRGAPKSKDVDETAGRQIGVNFEAVVERRGIRVKVSWRMGYFVATVHTL